MRLLIFIYGKSATTASDITVLRMDTMKTFCIKTIQSSLKRNIILRVKEVDYSLLKEAKFIAKYSFLATYTSLFNTGEL